jgi:hypothetical protein
MSHFRDIRSDLLNQYRIEEDDDLQQINREMKLKSFEMPNIKYKISNHMLVNSHLIDVIKRNIFINPVFSAEISLIQIQPLSDWIEYYLSTDLSNHKIFWTACEKFITVSFVMIKINDIVIRKDVPSCHPINVVKLSDLLLSF